MQDGDIPDILDYELEKRGVKLFKSYQWTEYREKNVNVASKKSYVLTVHPGSEMYHPAAGFLRWRVKIVKGGGSALALSGTGNNLTFTRTAMSQFRNLRLKFGKDTPNLDIDDIGMITLFKNIIYWDKLYAETCGPLQGFIPDTASDRAVGSDADINTLTISSIPLCYASNFGDGTSDRGCDKQLLRTGKNFTTTTVGDGAPALGVSNVVINPDFNEGFKKRVDAWSYQESKAREIDFFVPLASLFPFFDRMDKLVSGTDLEIKLDKQSDPKLALYGNIVTANTSDNPDFSITDMSLWVPTVDLESVYELKFLETINENEFSFYYMDRELFTTSDFKISASKKSIKYDIPVTRSQVRSLTAGAQLTKRDQNYRLNSGIFDYVARKFRCKLNGKSYPDEAYEITIYDSNVSDYRRSDYVRVLEDLWLAGNKPALNESAIVSYESWPTVYPIYHVDMTDAPDKVVGEDNASLFAEWTEAEGLVTDDSYRFFFHVVYERNATISFKNSILRLELN